MPNWGAGLIGALIGAVLTFIIGLLTLRFNYKRLFAKTVSESRNNWLNEIRSNLSLMLAIAKDKKKDKSLNEYYKARNEVLLRLNPSELSHVRLEKMISELDLLVENNENAEKVKDLEKDILNISKKILKEEWEKVKKEAGGKK